MLRLIIFVSSFSVGFESVIYAGWLKFWPKLRARIFSRPAALMSITSMTHNILARSGLERPSAVWSEVEAVVVILVSR